MDDYKEKYEKLLDKYAKQEKRYNKIIKQSDVLTRQLLDLNYELDEYKNNLEKKVEEEIEKRKDKEKILVQQSKLAAMGEMIDSIAHQWKQPLNLMSMKLDILEMENNDTHIKKFSKEMKEYINHMVDTLQEFRTFFRPNKELKEFSVEKIVRSVLLFVQDEFIKNNIEINLIVKNDFLVVGVENEFKHIILNILNNAKDAFNERNIEYRNIKIIIDNQLNIIDNAGGIPNSIINKIFDQNFTTKTEEKGTGIGLYMSKKIAIKCDGNLIVENIQNGAKFSFIPKVIKHSKHFLVKKILVVEDNKSNQMFMKVLLKKLDIEFKFANNGIEAINQVKKEDFDLILMDINMPKMNGIEAAKKIKEFKNIPIFALSADEVDPKKIGMDAFISKPLDIEELKLLIN